MPGLQLVDSQMSCYDAAQNWSWQLMWDMANLLGGYDKIHE
jgi:hypothetical protein